MTEERGVTFAPVDADGFADWARAVDRAFGEEPSEAALRSWAERFEPDRSLAGRRPDGTIVATAAAYTFDLAVPGGANVGCAGVTMVGVRQDHRRRGLLTTMMRTLLEDAIARQEPLAALWASEGAIYGRYGFGPAIPHLQLRVERHQLRLRAPGPVEDVEVVEPDVARAVLPDLYTRYRAQRAGLTSRSDAWWHHLVTHDPVDARDGAGPRTVAVLPDGGYVLYRLKPRWDDELPRGTVVVEELVSLHAEATAALWGFLAATDLASTIEAPARPVDDPLHLMLHDVSQISARRFPPVYVRILDIPAVLSQRRYLVDDELVLDVSDPVFPERGGRYGLTVADGAGRCEPTTRSADLHLDIEVLSTLVLGGVDARLLADAGRLGGDPATVGRLANLLGWSRAPVQPHEF